ncbi:MAG: SDR family oxidoreductase [Candidatus Thorarchaeota archaeon]|nr:MAG: SDR family oxidoreductase [Candidatus Thorarchaeota archaeon]
MDLNLKDRTYLVTAASRGLGFSVARALVDEGAEVIICGRNKDSLKKATTSLGELAQYFVADLSKKDDIKALVKNIGSQILHIDGLFVNAGGPPPGTFAKLTDNDWKKAFDLTLMSAVWLTRETLHLLKKSDSPSILYSTSISVKQPIDNLLLSNALRPAVIGMMRTLARELAPDIRVNAICPGYIYTERVEELMAASESVVENINTRIPLGRLGKPEEFGPVCAFLLSPIASYIHGALLLVDGGLYQGMM